MSALRAAYPLEEGRHIVLLYTGKTFLFYYGGGFLSMRFLRCQYCGMTGFVCMMLTLYFPLAPSQIS